MAILEAKMKCYPKKCEKYERMIQEEKSKLQRNREIRINQRIDFLRSFYNDLYEISQKDFTKKYKYHIADNILKTIEDLYFETYGRKGYYWTIFGDNKIHNGQDFSFTQYGKTLKPEETYAYYDNDNPWYKVTMGDNAVDIRVKGENGDVIITGLRNRLLNITILASK